MFTWIPKIKLKLNFFSPLMIKRYNVFLTFLFVETSFSPPIY